jgi:two-component system response regulator NreC
MDMPHLWLAPKITDSPALVAEQNIRVVLADDHALMRRTLRLMLDGEQDVEVIAEADDLTSLVRHLEAHQPHVLVLDLGMPDGSSSGAIRRLREHAPEIQIVIVTMQENPVFAQHALAAGAIGFVLKDRADEELAEAIRRAARGEQYVSPRLALPLDRTRRLRARTRPAETLTYPHGLAADSAAWP